MLPTISLSRFGTTQPSSLARVRREMDELFDRFFGEGNGSSLVPGAWYAPVALWEDDEHLYLEVEVPGVFQDDLELTVHQGTLRISGERKAPEADRESWYNERRYGRFERVISLPEAVAADSIKAELHDGILHVTLTKKPEAQPKRIPVKSR